MYPEGTGGEIISYWQKSTYGVTILIENSRPVFHLYSRDQSTNFAVLSNMKLKSSQWSHIAGSFDNRTGDAVLYVDGIQVGNKTGLGSLELQTEYDLWLGYVDGIQVGNKTGLGSLELQTEYDLWLGYGFKGKLSQIWIFNVSLDKEEITNVKDFMKPSPSELNMKYCTK